MESSTATNFLTFGSPFIKENKFLLELVEHIESRDDAFLPLFIHTHWLVKYFFRLCRISNSYVKRNVEGTHVNSTAVRNTSSPVAVASKGDPVHKTASVPQPQQKYQQQLSPRLGQQSNNVNNKSHAVVHEEASKRATEREKVVQFPADKKDLQDNKVFPGTGRSLATMWGRVSAKSRPVESPAETSNTKSNTCG